MSEMTLWGGDGSTYVRTIKMLLAEKKFHYFRQVQLNVLEGEPKTPEHLARHPFGKIPVLDHDGMHILETSAIARYLNDVLPGRSLVPADVRDRVRMDMIVSIVDFYGAPSPFAGSRPITFFRTSWAAATKTLGRLGLRTVGRFSTS